MHQDRPAQQQLAFIDSIQDVFRRVKRRRSLSLKQSVSHALEGRVLLSASLSGTVFEDANRNGQQNRRDHAVADALVWVDSNNNGQLDTQTTTYTSADTPKSLLIDPEDATIITNTSVLNISGTSGQILDIDLNLSMVAGDTFNGLQISLVHPSGKRILIFDSMYSEDANSQNVFNPTVFDDEAASKISLTETMGNYSGTYQPLGKLSDLDGLSANGQWKVEFWSIDGTGTLLGWSLKITQGEASDRTDANGRYTIDGLAAGQVNSLRVIVDSGVTPAVRGAFSDRSEGQHKNIPLTTNQQRTGLNFGITIDHDDQISDVANKPVLKIGTRSVNLETTTDVKLQRVQPQVGKTLKIVIQRTTRGVTPLLRLFDTNGNEIARSVSITRGRQTTVELEFRFLSSAPVYLGISSAQNTNYDALNGMGDIAGRKGRVVMKVKVS
jgi:hypothetical protein